MLKLKPLKINLRLVLLILKRILLSSKIFLGCNKVRGLEKWPNAVSIDLLILVKAHESSGCSLK